MIPVTLPQLSLAMEEGKVTRWLVRDGEKVAAGQAIVEIETDKALTEVEAPVAGTITLIAEEGAVIGVDTKLADIDDGAAMSQPATQAVVQTMTEAAADTSMVRDTAVLTATAPAPARKHRGSPAARRIARERGIDLSLAHGSGPARRIMVRDLAAPSIVANSLLREAVVAQLVASWREIPHIHIGGELDGAGLAAAKRAARTGTTVTDLLIYAVASALRSVPELNGRLGKQSERVHVSLAVATPSGVLSPVIRDTNQLSLAEISGERARLVDAARAGTSYRRDLAGGTITLTNLGAYPVDFFAPIVSGPQIVTLATGRLTERPVATNGTVAIRHRMWANVAIDHRAGDGVSGARFLAAIEHCLNELPSRLNELR